MDTGDIIWIAVLVLTVFGGSLTKLFRGMIKEMPQPVPTQNKKSMDFPTKEDPSTPYSQEGTRNESFAEEYGTDEYFTYETPVNAPMADVDTENRVASVPVNFTGRVASNAVDETCDCNFNLRQAVIYQTILQNNYITELNR